MKKIYVVLECEVDEDTDIVELDGHLHDLSAKEFPSQLHSVNYWHVSFRGYDEKLPAKKKGKKKAA